jgi:hypothetical protein
MAVTTAAEIRDAMRSAVRAITPSLLAHVPFKAHDERVPLRQWAELNKTAAFRWFSVRDTGDVVPPVVSNMDRDRVETTFEFVTAYPLDYRYGNQLALDMDDVVESDLRQVEHKIGSNGYSLLDLTTGGDATVTTIGTSRESGESCAFGVLRLRVEFWRQMS